MQFSVVDTQFNQNGEILLNFLKSDGEKDSFKAEYLTTIKSNYTQRIANHAFSYPIRVGVDFVKK
jgi:imidazole glycerol phosphate synthase subunit HisF